MLISNFYIFLHTQLQRFPVLWRIRWNSEASRSSSFLTFANCPLSCNSILSCSCMSRLILGLVWMIYPVHHTLAPPHQPHPPSRSMHIHIRHKYTICLIWLPSEHLLWLNSHLFIKRPPHSPISLALACIQSDWSKPAGAYLGTGHCLLPTSASSKPAFAGDESSSMWVSLLNIFADVSVWAKPSCQF